MHFRFKVYLKLVSENKTQYALKSEASTQKSPGRDYPKSDNNPKSLHDINNDLL